MTTQSDMIDMDLVKKSLPPLLLVSATDHFIGIKSTQQESNMSELKMRKNESKEDMSYKSPPN
jgi:hypothetical protein